MYRGFNGKINHLHNKVFPFRASFMMGSSMEKSAAAGQDFAKCAIRGVPCTVVNPQTGALLSGEVWLWYRTVELDVQMTYVMLVVGNRSNMHIIQYTYIYIIRLGPNRPTFPLFVRSVCRHSLSGVFPRVFFGLATPSSSGRLESRFRVNRKTLSFLLHCLGTDFISGQPPLQFGFRTHG